MFLLGRIGRAVSVALERGWRMHFSPQPSYRAPKSNSQFAGSQRGVGPPIHFESISLNRDENSPNRNSLVRYLPLRPATLSGDSEHPVGENPEFCRLFELFCRVSGLRKTTTLASSLQLLADETMRKVRTCSNAPIGAGEKGIFS